MGDYRAAADTLDEAIARLEEGNAAQALDLLRAEAFQGALGPQTLMGMTTVLRNVGLVGQFAEIRGLLALEEGDLATATRWFRRGEELSNNGQLFLESRAIGKRYLQLIEAAGGAK
jgi:hypothetical protein